LYAIMSRLVLSIITAAVIYQMIALLPEALQGEKNVEALGFLAGIFPSTLLNYVKAGLKKTIQASTESEEMSLDMIQGISPWRMFRLYDTGLDDCENFGGRESNRIMGCNQPFSAGNYRLGWSGAACGFDAA
jgi:hypothetical protein